jgi:hypothetical protein
MTVLGTAAKVYAGGVVASAVYAGTVKVWPTAPAPPPSMATASWSTGMNQVLMTIVAPSPPIAGSYDVACGPNPGYNTLQRRFAWSDTSAGGATTLLNLANAVWNGYYPEQWADHVVRFTLDGAHQVVAFQIIGPVP